MKIDTHLLYVNLRNQLEYNGKLPQVPELVEDWLIEPWRIHRTLIDKNKSPYFHPYFEGIPMRLSFYEMCFFAFMSGVEYSFLKNSVRFRNIDYWEMHKTIRAKFMIQAKMLYKGALSRDKMSLFMGGASEMGKGGVETYMIIANSINLIFKQVFHIEDHEIFDEEGYEIESLINNLPDVLHVFHDVATLCSKYIIDMNEQEFRKNTMMGGPGMSSIFIDFS